MVGQWERALNPLEVAATLDPGALAMAQTYREALRCELLRAQVFEAARPPCLRQPTRGSPSDRIAAVTGRGQRRKPKKLRAQAFEERRRPRVRSAERLSSGSPMPTCVSAGLEAVINGRYYWVPFLALQRHRDREPADLRDVVWTPAHLMLENGGEAYALVPTRYPGTEKLDEGALLARKTTWDEQVTDFYCGLGQRVLSTDGGEVSLMDVRDIVFTGATQADAPN